MKYELAKELKDAGFPQETEKRYEKDSWTWGYKHEGWRIWSCEDRSQGEIGPAAPTLPELIGACSESFRVLERFPLLGDTEKEWFAYGVLERTVTQTEVGMGGRTPEIAVARLWLALNK